MTHVEGTIERPGYKYPWVYVIQDGEGGGFAWAVYSQSGTRPVHRGESPTVEVATAEAKISVEG